MTATRFTARSLDDLFASLHAGLGFRPRESVCAIALHDRVLGFTVRVDLPEDPVHLPGIAAHVAGHVRRRVPDAVIVLAHSVEVDAARTAALAVEDALGSVPCELVAWSDGVRAWSTEPGCPEAGEPVSPESTHPVLAEAVLAGHEVLTDREGVEEAWVPFPVDPTAQESVMDEAAWQMARDLVGWPAASVDARAAQEVIELVHRADAPGPCEAARTALWLSRPGVRDEVWPRVHASEAQRWCAALRQVARLVAAPHSAVPYTMAGYAAYLSGHGAHASCAFERALEAAPDYLMAHGLSSALWVGVDPGTIEAWVSGRVGTVSERGRKKAGPA